MYPGTPRAKYNQLKRELQSACRTAHDEYLNDLITEEVCGKKKLWSYVKSKRSEAIGVSPLKQNGQVISDNQIQAETLNNQFSSVYTKEGDTPLPEMGTSPHPDSPNISITLNGVEKLLNKINPHKATGPDEIPTRLLKEASYEIAPIITLLFQASLKQGTLPKDWLKANMVPAFKKGDRGKPENYRPISLTSVLCKIMEHIVHSQIMKHFENYSILTDAQHGFRKQRSCESQLLIAIHDLARTLEEGGQMDCIMLDFSKAFDKVPHKRLLHKLHYYGVRGETLNWIQAFLSSRTQTVLVNGKQSKQAPVLSGVPQGTVLGPLLFLAYINDMPECVSSDLRLFADDSLLYRRIKSVEDATILQQDLDKLQEWESKWLMQFHPEKCFTLRVTKKTKPLKSNYTIHGHTLLSAIDQVPKSQQKRARQEEEASGKAIPNTAKYLGVYINGKLSWNHHVYAVTKKATSTLWFLHRNTASCPRSVKKYCYKAYIRPQLKYASTVLTPHTQ